MNTMDYDHWMLGEELELFSPLPLEQKAANVQDGVGLSDLISPAGDFLDQLEDAAYPADNELFPKWMTEKISLNFLDEIQESSSESVAEDSGLLPLDDLDGKNEKTELSDMDLLHQLVAESITTMQPLPVEDVNTQGDALAVTKFCNNQEGGLTQDELWEALGAASGLSSPTSSEEMSVFSPASSEDMVMSPSGSPMSLEDTTVFASGSSPLPSDDMTVFVSQSPAPSVVLAVCSGPNSGTPISPLPNVQTSKLIEPNLSKARPVLKTVGGSVKPSRKERKKDQNKHAATRYREKKRSQGHAIKGELDGLEQRNVELKDTVESMTKEIKYLKDLLQEVLAVKGQLKQMAKK